MRCHSISGQRSRAVSSLETSLGALLKFDKRKGLREKPANIIWSIRSSELPRSQQWMPPPCGEDSLCQKIRQLICCSHVFLIKDRMIQVRSLKQTDPDRLCAFSWRASGLGFVLSWSFESLPQCLRIRRVGLSLNCWECWVVRGQLTQ